MKMLNLRYFSDKSAEKNANFWYKYIVIDIYIYIYIYTRVCVHSRANSYYNINISVCI